MKKAYIKYGFKEFERNIYFNIFVILQLCAALILIVYCVSSLSYVSKFYSPLKSILSTQGVCTTDIANYETLDEISEREYVDEVYSYDCASGFIDGQKNAAVNSYDSDFIKSYKPLLEKGKWLDEYDNEGDVKGAVISYTDEYKIGDELTVVFDPDTENERSQRLVIIGMLCDGAKVFNAYSALSEVSDASSLYPSYNSKEHNSEILLLTEKGDALNGYPGMSLIKFKSGYSDSEYEGFTSALAEEYIIKGVKLSKIMEASTKEIDEQRIMILPLIIGISVLIFVSVLSMSAISSNRQLKSYGIYTILGATRTGCVLIQVFSCVCCCICSSLLAVLIYNLLKLSGRLSQSVITVGTSELSLCLVLIVLTILISMIMPTLIVGRKEVWEMVSVEE